MAGVKSFGITGVAASLQFAKAGPQIVASSGSFLINQADGATPTDLTARNINAVSNFVLTTNGGQLIINGLTVMQKTAAGYPQIPGTGTLLIPTGNTAARPFLGVVGMIRVNTQSAPVVEYYNGTAWSPLAAGAAPTLDTIFPATSPGNIIYASGSDLWLQGSPGSGSGVQPFSNNLTALAAKSSTGVLVQTGASTYSSVSITGTSGNIVVGNGDGVAGNPTINLATVTDTGTGTFLKLTRDTFGRISGTTAVTASDINGLISGTYVLKTGDTMSGSLTFTGGAIVTGLPSPTGGSDAANKAYVDSVATGISSWKIAVIVATTVNITLSGAQTIDSIAVVAGNRVLVKNQISTPDNGIYVVAAGAWARSTDANTPVLLDGAAVYVQQGTTFGDTAWVETATITSIGVSPVIWAQFGAGATYSAGTGLTLTGNTFSVNLGAGIGQIPAGNVGIDLFDTVTGALILTTDGSTRSTLVGSQIYLLLDPANNALQQSSTGLLAQLATTSQLGVASFNTTSFSVTSGAVTLKTVDVPHGGTGATSFTTGDILYGNGTSPIQATSGLTFNGTDTIQVGGASGLSIQGNNSADSILTVLGTNGNLQLIPNGTGAVIAGPLASDGLVQSEAGHALVVTGNTTLTLNSVTGALTLGVSSGTSSSTKVEVTGPTASDYATNLNATSLVNKFYVDAAISGGVTSGSLKGYAATVSLAATGTTNIGAVLPTGAIVVSVKVSVTSVDTGTGTLSVGVSGTVAAYMTTTENNPQVLGIYIAETYTSNSGVQVIATVAGSPVSGSASVLVEYLVP